MKNYVELFNAVQKYVIIMKQDDEDIWGFSSAEIAKELEAVFIHKSL